MKIKKIKLKYHYFRKKIIKLSAISKNKANPIKHFETARFDYIRLTITTHTHLIRSHCKDLLMTFIHIYHEDI